MPTIPSGGTKTPAIPLSFGYITSIGFPAEMTGTEVSFEAAADLTGSFRPIYSGGVPYTEPVVAGVWARIDASLCAGYAQVKIVSNAAEAAARVLDVTIVR